MLGFFKNQSNKKLLCDVKLLKVISYMYVCVCERARVCLRFRYKLQTEVSDAFRVSDATSSTTFILF